MGRVLYKVLCANPLHKEETPSCAVYEDGSAFCFGCRAFFSKLVDIDSLDIKEKPSEDLPAKITYIKSLPTTKLRGLEFHFDNTGYYILWPTSDYYKCRRWTTTDTTGKYLSPSGHLKPVFRCLHQGATKTLFVVEGEINALSVAESGVEADVVSPGGVGNFTDKTTKAYLPEISKYATVKIIVDQDVVGLIAALKLQNLIRPICLHTTIKLMEHDANTVLEKYGKEALKEELGV